jgi:threonyl-tRNA synthetase
MREIIARDKPFTKEVWSREKAKQVFRDKGEAFKVELVDAIPATRISRSITRATGSTSAAART